MESTHLLGAKKRVKIHPHTVTAKYATQAAPAPYSPVQTHFPQPGDEGYDDAPSFEDFGSFLDESSDRKKLTDGSRKWPRTLFGSRDRERDTVLRLQPSMGDVGEGVGVGGGAKGPGRGVGEQLASFGEASVSASRWTWAGLLGAALAHGGLMALTRLASERFALGPLFLLSVRSVVQLVSVAVPLRRGEHPFGPEGYRLRLLCYGVAYSLALCCAYSSLTIAAPGEAAATWRLATTALSATLAFLLLEERLALADGVAVAAGLVGLGLVLVPDGVPESGSRMAFWRSAFGWSLSALAGLWMALALVGYRSLKERVGVGTALFTVSWTGCLLSPATLGLLQEGWSWPAGPAAWGLVLGLVACSVLAFLGMTHALTRLHPALVSASQSLEVPVAMLLQLPLLPRPPSAPEIVGDVVVALSVGGLVAMKLLPSRGTARRQREEYEEILDSPIK